MAITQQERKFSDMVLAQVGKRYILGAEVKCSDPNPKAFDCSELVEWSFCRTGVAIRDLAAWQYQDTAPIKTPLRVGDLCFLKNNPQRPGGIGHVGIVVADSSGHLLVVEAKGRVWGVVKSTVAGWAAKSTFAGWRRSAKLAAVLRPAVPQKYVEVYLHTSEAELAAYKAFAASHGDFITSRPAVKDSYKVWKWPV